MTTNNLFYLTCHGIQNIHESLSYKERSNVTILAFGVEGHLVYVSRVETMINFFIHTIGQSFLMELINHIILHGKDFYKSFLPKGQKYWKELNLIFEVYALGLKSHPYNQLRVYSYRDKIQNLSLAKNIKDETVKLNFIIDFKDIKVPVRPFPFEKSDYLYDINKINTGEMIPSNEEYHLYNDKNIIYPNYYTIYENTPIDLYEFINKKYVPIMDMPVYPHKRNLKEICEIIKILTPPQSKNFLFLSACKGYHKNMMEISDAYQILNSQSSFITLFKDLKLRDTTKRKKREEE